MSTSQEFINNKIERLRAELKAIEVLLADWKEKELYAENPAEIGRCRKKIEMLEAKEDVVIEGIIELEAKLPGPLHGKPAAPNNQDETFDILCSFDFTHQTQYFDSLISGEKSFLSFVVRGKQELYGQEWLVNKLINRFQRGNKTVHDTIVFDFGELNASLAQFIDALSQYLGVTYDYIQDPVMKKTKLRNALQNRIATKSQFIVIRNAYAFIHSPEFADFLRVISYFHDEFNNAELAHKCIFFFVELHCNDPYLHTQHCLFSSEMEAYHARICSEFRFIDLDAIQSVPEAEVKRWIANTPRNVFDRFRELLDDGDKLKAFIADGNPQKLIPGICEKLGKNYFEYESKWRKQ